MIDALQAAREAMGWSEDDSVDSSTASWYFAKAQAYATIAQAEAATRQAAALERIADTLSTLGVSAVEYTLANGQHVHALHIYDIGKRTT